jgi:hypothetical protein
MICYQSGDAEMEVGPYLLEGSTIKLKNPYLVTEKSGSNSTQATMSVSTETSSLMMRGIVRKKIVFKTRPKPKPIGIAFSK